MGSDSDKIRAVAQLIGRSLHHIMRDGTDLSEWWKRFVYDEEGRDLAECALLLVFLIGIFEEVREG